MSIQSDEMIIISRKVYSNLIVSAAEGLPNETGGIVYSYTDKDGQRTQNSRTISNVHSSPSHNYSGSASETLALYEYLGEVEGEIDFIWHSHPTAGHRPSEIDKGLHYPSRYLAIVSFNNGAPQLSLWRVKDWKFISWRKETTVPDLTRDAMIEAAAKATHASRCCPCDETGCDYPNDLWGEVGAAEIAVDAALLLIADDLDAYADDEDCDCQTDSDVTTCDCIRHLTAGGIRDAAARIRALLPSTLRIGNLSHGEQYR